LLAFLASRPAQSATRDQVLEAMWPNQSPEGAANSLHQTLFFLRRDIDPWYDEQRSVNYLVVEPDVVFLDPELVQVDSAAFFRQISAALVSQSLAETGVPILRDYTAKFALDFEYEEWSIAWREQLHALFLQASQATAEALIAAGRHQLAIDVVERALTVDPSALALEGSLVLALHDAGATAAATHQYRHYASVFEEETGTAAPSFESLVTPRRTKDA
jgi:DNA-binding SARP family transcriptional activator